MLKKFLLATVAFLLLINVVYCAPTEEEFKKMKMKDLRDFLNDRGLDCVGCQEKSDFVRVAFANRDKPLLASAVKREVPDGKFWDVWGLNAKNSCHDAVKKRGNDPESKPFSEICITIEKAIEGFFMQHGRQVANKLKKTPSSLLKTSYKDIYYDAGMRLVGWLSNQCLSSPDQQKKCESLSTVMKMVEKKDFLAWITNVGIENTNPMYDIIDAGDL